MILLRTGSRGVWLILLVQSFSLSRANFLTVVNGVEFETMTKVLRTDFWTAFHIEEDEWIPGNLLFSTYGYLSTLSLAQPDKPSIIVGDSGAGYVESIGRDARFRGISGFRQLNQSHVLLTDLHNHCVRLVNRNDNSTRHIAGLCGLPGFRDGEFSAALFDYPQNIINGRSEDEYFLTDRMNNAVRQLSFKDMTISTLVQDPAKLLHPIDLIMNKDQTKLLITVFNGLARINISSKIVTALTNTSLPPGTEDGDSRSAKFNKPWKLTSVSYVNNSDVYIITDKENNKLRVFDEQNDMFSSICRGIFSSNDGDVSTCCTNRPYSVYWSKRDSTLYIGAQNYIRKLPAREVVAGSGDLSSEALSTIAAPSQSSPSSPPTTRPTLKPPSTAGADSSLTVPQVASTSVTRQSGSTTSGNGSELPEETTRKPVKKRHPDIIAYLIYAGLGVALLAVIFITFTLIHRLRFSKRISKTKRSINDPLPPRPVPSAISTLSTYNDLPNNSVTSSMSRGHVNHLYDSVGDLGIPLALPPPPPVTSSRYLYSKDRAPPEDSAAEIPEYMRMNKGNAYANDNLKGDEVLSLL